MEEPGQRAGRRGVPSEDGLRRLIAAWASDVQPGVPAEEDAEAPALDGRLLQCVIGGGAFAFPLAAVTEVVPYAPPRRLPGQPVEAGVTMLRGEPLPTLDAAARMGMEVDETAARMVVLATRDGPCAVVVSETGEIAEVDPGRLAPPPAGAGASEYVVALVEIGGKLVAVLDPERLCRRHPPTRGSPHSMS
jgi:chemotaxis signal transduction protein